ncbi:DNA mismatch repair protein MutS [Blattabacterium cuenoti]|uniref:DNA mismatch repair protein MutS n=1 Tax=Blattabacterium cuenoti TaxID=1653831 RepID=UPI00163C021F|nr:DNA mismatch repair protein MutS [Blattabacterium cuenoti]
MNLKELNNKKEETPLIKQYNNIKKKYPNSILLFQVGDFYETFGKDAIMCSKILNIVLTRRSKKITHLAGFPCHSLNNYLSKLIKSGVRIAICNQLEEPIKGKNIVKRGVVELITPGVILNENILKNKKNNFLASIHIDKKKFGLSLLDISTGDFFIIEDKENYLLQYINHFQPNEIIFQKSKKDYFNNLLKNNKYPIFLIEDWIFNFQNSYEKLIFHFKTNSLKGFGIEHMKLGIVSSGVILFYVTNNQYYKIDHISNIRIINRKKFMWIDDYTFNNLEIFQSINKNGTSLIKVLDNTITSMGGRLLKNWLLFPLIDIDIINKRIQIVKELYLNNSLRNFIEKKLKGIYDLERIISRMVVGKTNPKETLILNKSIFHIEEIKKKIIIQKKKSIQIIGEYLECFNCIHVYKEIKKTIIEDALPYQMDKEIGKTIKEGVSQILDKTRKLYLNQKEFLEKIIDKEKTKTKIKNIKINFNNAFGYSFEIKKKDKKNVPNYWIQKQILANIIRYTTQDLKNYELNILNIEKKIVFLEKELFNKLIKNILKDLKNLQNISKIIAELDVLCSFSSNALKNNYSEPKINDSYNLLIKNGRHPVIEKNFLDKNSYIPNNIFLDKKTQQIIIITGPNMSGKSAVLRQTAIIVLMSQIGSYIPAEYAEIGIIDKIFSRIGATDNISIGESTFMVEMNETANILNNFTKRSLIILDEIGRGTSTNEGVALAKSIIEFLHEDKLMPFTLFATHYHELNQIYLNFYRVKNYHISVKKINNNIIFIRKLLPGTSKSSMGIHVAKISGIPIKIINRANNILKNIENDKKNYLNEIIKEIKNIKLLSYNKKLIIIEKIKNLLKNYNY